MLFFAIRVIVGLETFLSDLILLFIYSNRRLLITSRIFRLISEKVGVDRVLSIRESVRMHAELVSSYLKTSTFFLVEGGGGGFLERLKKNYD